MQVNASGNLTFARSTETRIKAAKKGIDILQRKHILTPEEAKYTKNCVVYPTVVNLVNGKPSTLKRLANIAISPVYEIFVVKSQPIVDKILEYHRKMARI